MTEKDSLRDIYDLACDQHLAWMHFHEVAISDPFKAESEAMDFCRKILKMALAAGIERGHKWRSIA